MIRKKMYLRTLKRENLIVDIIFQHKGEENAVTAKEISAFVSANGYSINENAVHCEVSKIILKRRLPICVSSAKGYYWANKKTEIINNINVLQKRIDAIQKRIDLLSEFIID